MQLFRKIQIVFAMLALVLAFSFSVAILPASAAQHQAHLSATSTTSCTVDCIKLSPSTVSFLPGTHCVTFYVYGSHWLANHPMQINLFDDGANILLGQTTTNSVGAFTFDVTRVCHVHQGSDIVKVTDMKIFFFNRATLTIA